MQNGRSSGNGKRSNARRGIVLLVSVALFAITLPGCDVSPAGAFLEVDELRCNGCTECVGVCIADAIRMIDRKAVIDPTKCVECGRCIEVCPVNAIQ